MHTIKLTLLLILLTSQVKGQNQTDADTLTDVDTIYQHRTVEKVLYVYAAPENYFSIGAQATLTQPHYSGQNAGNKPELSYRGTVIVQYQQEKWLYLGGIGMQHYVRKAEYSTEYHTISKTQYQHTDTVSHYIVETPAGIRTEYITESSIRDTIHVTSETVKKVAEAHYRYLQFPISIGRQLRHGFLCIDGYAGLVPGILVSNNKAIFAYSGENTIMPENLLLRRFICDAQVAVSFRYLLTFSSFISAGVYCSVPLMPMYRSVADKPLRKYDAGISLSFSYILFEGK